MNKDDKDVLINKIHNEMLKFKLRYDFPFEKGSKHGFEYFGFFISIPNNAWLLLCWADESQKHFKTSFWLELSSRAAKKWREGGINSFTCDDIVYNVRKHPNDHDRLVIPLEITHDNMKNVIDLIISVSKEVLEDY